MFAKKIKCTVEEIRWTTATMLCVRFRTDRPFRFLAGQFISIQIPGALKGSRATKRLYSLVSTPEEAKDSGIYELCIKYVASGMGSEFLARCSEGDSFVAYAPYGDFYFRPQSAPAVCFIGTGSGIAPIRSMVLSNEFQEHRPKKAIAILGVRTEQEKIFVPDFQRSAVETVYAVSKPASDYAGFRGRVTDYLKKIAGTWDFTTTEFYLCGNAEMIAEIQRLLRTSGVPAHQIHKEAFSSHNGLYAPRNVIPLRRTPEKKATKVEAIDITSARKR
jgi:ferredoxin-NADP reductase